MRRMARSHFGLANRFCPALNAWLPKSLSLPADRQPAWPLAHSAWPPHEHQEILYLLTRAALCSGMHYVLPGQLVWYCRTLRLRPQGTADTGLVLAPLTPLARSCLSKQIAGNCYTV